MFTNKELVRAINFISAATASAITISSTIARRRIRLTSIGHNQRNRYVYANFFLQQRYLLLKSCFPIILLKECRYYSRLSLIFPRFHGGERQQPIKRETRKKFGRKILINSTFFFSSRALCIVPLSLFVTQ